MTPIEEKHIFISVQWQMYIFLATFAE